MLDHIFARQHIQNHTADSAVIHHWGYADRVVPCTNDIGSCEYLDAVYWMHDVSMPYTFILWAVLGGLLAIFLLSRAVKPARARKAQHEVESGRGMSRMGFFTRCWKAKSSTLRRVLLPESFNSVFGNVTRLQLLLLAILVGYLVVFS